jgi:hypothetical protein
MPTPAQIKARGERARQIVEAHRGQITARLNRNRTLIAEIPSDIAVHGFPRLRASGFDAVLLGHATYDRPAWRVVNGVFVELNRIEPIRLAIYQIDLAAPLPPVPMAAPLAAIQQITKQTSASV